MEDKSLQIWITSGMRRNRRPKRLEMFCFLPLRRLGIKCYLQTLPGDCRLLSGQ